MRYASPVFVTVVLALVGAAHAQPFDTIINVPPDPTPTAVQSSSTQVNVLAGGVVGSDVACGGTGLANIEFNVLGGVVGSRLSIREGARLNLSSGFVGRGLVAGAGSSVTITGGEVQDGSGGSPFTQDASFVVASDGSALVPVHLSGGKVGRLVRLSGANMTMSGGDLGVSTQSANPNIRLDFGTQLHVTGGFVGRHFSDTYSTNPLQATTTTLRGGFVDREFRAVGNLNLVGGEFSLNGAGVTSLATPVSASDVLSGVLEDGSVVIFSPLAGDLVTANLSPPVRRFGRPTLVPAPLPTAAPVVNVIAPGDAIPKGVRAGQTLNLGAGRSMRAFGAVEATVNLAGEVEVLETARSTVNVSAGARVGRVEMFGGNANIRPGSEVGDLRTYAGTRIDIAGGTTSISAVRNSFLNISAGHVLGGSVLGASTLTVSGGSLSGIWAVDEGSNVAISGGSINESDPNAPLAVIGGQCSVTGGSIAYLSLDGGSEARISGGVIRMLETVPGVLTARTRASISGGSILSLGFMGGDTHVFGRSFTLNGIDLTATLLPDQPFAIAERSGVLSGQLFDGSPFSFDLANFGDVLTITVPAPGTLLVLMSTCMFGFRRRRGPVIASAGDAVGCLVGDSTQGCV